VLPVWLSMWKPPDLAAITLIVVLAFGLAACTATSIDEKTATETASKTVSSKPAPDQSAQRSESGRGSGTRSGHQERAVRLGCHEYCLTAAGRGGEEQKASDTIVGLEVENPVVAFDDGTIPVRIYCFVERDCEGAIFVFGEDIDFGEGGRSDLLVAAGKNRLIAAPLPALAVDSIESGKRINMKVVADVLPTFESLSPDDQDGVPDFYSLSIVVVGS
jgi:hypothetical protein